MLESGALTEEGSREFRQMIQRDADDFHLFEGYYRDRNYITWQYTDEEGDSHVITDARYLPYLGCYYDPVAQRFLQDSQCHFYVVFNDGVNHTTSADMEGIKKHARLNFPEIVDGEEVIRDLEYWPVCKADNLAAQHSQAEIILDYYRYTDFYQYNETDKEFIKVPWATASEYNLVDGKYYTLISTKFIVDEKYNNKADYYVRNNYQEAHAGEYQEDIEKFYDHVGQVSYKDYCAQEHFLRQDLYAKLLDSMDVYGVKYCPYCGHKEVLNFSNAVAMQEAVQCPHCGEAWNIARYELDASGQYVAVPNLPIKNTTPIRIDLDNNYGEDKTYVDDTIIFEVKDLSFEDIQSIRVGSGVILDASYLLLRKTYSFEPENLLEEYNTAKENYESLFTKQWAEDMDSDEEKRTEWNTLRNEYAATFVEAWNNLLEQTEINKAQYLRAHGLD